MPPDEGSTGRRLTIGGCLGVFVGEALFYVIAAILAGVLVLAARGFDVLLQKRAVIGLPLLILLTVAFVYGLVWTIRVGPGLYLENLKGDPEKQQALGQEGRRLRIAGMIYLQVVCLTIAGYVITVLVWSRP